MPPMLLAAALLAGSITRPDTTGEDLVRRMHDRYEGKWPESVTFVQTSTFYDGDSVHAQTWYEAVGAPSKLRIDFAPVDSGNAVIFRNDSIYRFRGDSMVGAVAQIHPLMVLSRDVYALPPARTVEKLRQLGFEVGKMREDTWQDRPVYVVGAEAGDLTTPQFWVDREDLVFVRLLQPAQQDSTRTEDIRFNKYRRLGDGWIETEVLVFENGDKVFSETYDHIREAPDLPESLWDPRRWGRPGWVESEERAD